MTRTAHGWCVSPPLPAVVARNSLVCVLPTASLTVSLTVCAPHCPLWWRASDNKAPRSMLIHSQDAVRTLSSYMFTSHTGCQDLLGLCLSMGYLPALHAPPLLRLLCRSLPARLLHFAHPLVSILAFVTPPWNSPSICLKRTYQVTVVQVQHADDEPSESVLPHHAGVALVPAFEFLLVSGTLTRT
jgi:hypothetical protein